MAARKSPWLLLGLLVAGCATRPDPTAQFMDQLLAMLPGSYDNLAQARGSPEHAPLRLVIAPVQALLVGDHVFYVQEMAADNPQRVLAQYLYQVNEVQGREMAVASQADFAEPLRWRNGQSNRDLFHALLPQDLRPRAGCDLLFKRDGAGFAAALTGSCRGSAADTGEALRVEQRITLDADGIAMFEQRRDAAGRLTYGEEADPWYRFARRADAPW